MRKTLSTKEIQLHAGENFNAVAELADTLQAQQPCGLEHGSRQHFDGHSPGNGPPSRDAKGGGSGFAPMPGRFPAARTGCSANSESRSFCEEDFWHGRRWGELRKRIANGANASYWVPKIECNIQRDRQVNRSLRKLGWRVVRVWESTVLANPDRVASRILAIAKKGR